ncbi:uncharacterized protein STEHIDRAFT_117483 [Stereum hirsutum FP-91666 SS1]|uniref:uncharacterized protein n=1 Tax=Stereum hirsutum (strain FP-91666) TaxID=721885 RepID=UPI000440A9E0|nr:uncharacterized protein STEHIDRAFT_117483 [Stereum hirsutum FP-91666 SS1]EIM92472.1 hypothetical protein STEHIDRAFT_117483 [Stereum hirsutum FP-91666 SS1]
MGSLCSKSSTHSGGHTVLDSSAPSYNRRQPAAKPVAPPPNNRRGQKRGQPLDSSGAAPAKDPRAAAAEAAEQRLKAAQSRGTNASNPNRGRLAAQVEANNKAGKLPEPQQEERLVWD